MANDLARRLKALEEARPTVIGNRHCIMWWPGQPWAEVIARYGADRIKRGHPVMLLKFEGAGDGPDPVMVRDAAIADRWLAERGATHA